MKVVACKDNPSVIEDFCSLNKNAFPKSEVGSNWFLRHHIKKRNSKLDLLCYYDNNDFIGYSLTTSFDGYVDLHMLAVNPTNRGKGYGSQILSYLKDLYSDKTLFLSYEVLDKEAKNYEQRLKRAEFYNKNGFKTSNLFIREFLTKMEVVTFNEVNNINLSICQKGLTPFWPLWICKIAVKKIKG